MGVGEPEGILEVVAPGVDMFDWCCRPAPPATAAA